MERVVQKKEIKGLSKKGGKRGFKKGFKKRVFFKKKWCSTRGKKKGFFKVFSEGWSKRGSKMFTDFLVIVLIDVVIGLIMLIIRML